MHIAIQRWSSPMPVSGLLRSVSHRHDVLLHLPGTALLGRCDDLKRIEHVCEEHDLWLHVIGRTIRVNLLSASLLAFSSQVICRDR